MHNYKKHPNFKTTTLPEGKTSAYTACVECGQKFTQRNATTRFRALDRHILAGCSKEQK